ncbi:RidA family protein [Rhodopseudomonas palustris]|uniref:RidA family protein n=1 Tax=Rhodopseudomonas palustris TaxID=1076 RepID=UPI000D1C1753|nr:RidA family protein [Rhodopseudomonas palustris]AVT81371.1 translation initiation inhibitor [Rhodopseudomonas palustris]
MKATLRTLFTAAALAMTLPAAASAETSAVKIIAPTDKTITPSGTWSIGARAGDFVFIGGMRGTDRVTGKMVDGDEARIRRMFDNMLAAAEAAGATKADAVRLTVFVTDVAKYRPVVNKVQKDIWGDGPYPPRTVLQVPALDQGDIAEIDGTFYAPAK